MLPYNNCGDVLWAINRKIWFLQRNHKIIAKSPKAVNKEIKELVLITRFLGMKRPPIKSLWRFFLLYFKHLLFTPFREEIQIFMHLGVRGGGT